MQTVLAMESGGMLLGALYPKDAEMFWSIDEFEVTPTLEVTLAFEEVRSLFDEELRILKPEGELDGGLGEVAEVHIQHQHPSLALAEGGGEIRVFALHIYRNGRLLY